jgi:protein gp37
MGTAIEWTDETWNPVTGCTKVSPGCDHCYAERVTERFHGPGSFERVVLHPDRLEKPLHWCKPRKVFVNSMSDLFHDEIPDEFIARVFAVMSLAPRHQFQLLTKRHGRMRSVLGSAAFEETVRDIARTVKYGGGWSNPRLNDVNYRTWPLPNVWIGVSAEDQKRAELRIPALLETPAAVRFVSLEPLLGPIDLDAVPLPSPQARPLDWVIVGGESGRSARPMHAAWARDLRDQCVTAGVPFLFKQWGGYTQKAGGRELDGRTWDEYPAARP